MRELKAMGAGRTRSIGERYKIVRKWNALQRLSDAELKKIGYYAEPRTRGGNRRIDLNHFCRVVDISTQTFQRWLGECGRL